MSVNRDGAVALHRARYGRRPEFCVRAPGRVNLIGEHVDYNGGTVLPMAIGLGTTLACGKASGPDFELVSAIAPDHVRTVGRARSGVMRGDWTDYFQGVLNGLLDGGYDIPPLSIALSGDLPTGKGLSSSAALCVGMAGALAHAAGIDLSAMDIARIAHSAETDHVGVRCGMMDQLASAAGRAGHAVRIDCRSLALEYIPLPTDWAVVVADTGVRRELASTPFNDRRAGCDAAARQLGVRDLGELAARPGHPDLSALNTERQGLVRHVVSEIERVRQTVDACRTGDIAAMAKVMRASHASLRDDYRVSLPEIDRFVDQQNAFLGERGGARLMGGGFGGCTVAVVRRDAADGLREAIEREGKQSPDGDAAWPYQAEPAGGMRIDAC